LAGAIEVFDQRAASQYESWYETPQGLWAEAEEREALARLLECFTYPGSVLEVGCGTGHFTRWLSATGLAAVGLDLSAAMLAQARTLGDATLVHGDALRLPFSDDAFDLVAFVTTIEFLDEPREALKEALRVAQQGLILGVLNRWSTLGLRRRLAGLRRSTVYSSARFFGLGELERLLRSVSGEEACILWRTALLPRCWPRALAQVPWGGFIGMALIVDGTGRGTANG
jgi:SAM-dependent methyltransferase